MAPRLSIIITLIVLMLALGAAPAYGAIHPISSLECAAPNGSDVANLQNPIGQFKGGAELEAAFFAGQAPATGSFLRAVIATRLVLVDEDGFFVGIDPTVGALNGDSGAGQCPNV